MRGLLAPKLGFSGTSSAESGLLKGIPDFQAPPPIPRFIDTAEAIDELPS